MHIIKVTEKKVMSAFLMSAESSSMLGKAVLVGEGLCVPLSIKLVPINLAHIWSTQHAATSSGTSSTFTCSRAVKSHCTAVSLTVNDQISLYTRKSHCK